MKALGLRAYARHREAQKLPGGTLRAVQVAIKEGRLSTSLTDDRAKIISAELADTEWAASTKADYVPLTGPTAPAHVAAASSPLADARARREAAQADIREMEVSKLRGELVSVKQVEKEITTLIKQCRTRLLALPRRARQRDATLTDAHLALMDMLIREALEDLAEPKQQDADGTAAG